MLKRISLENTLGEVVRIFLCQENMKGHLIFLKDKKRLELVEDIKEFETRKQPFKKISDVDILALGKQALEIPGLGRLALANNRERTILNVERLSEGKPLVSLSNLIGMGLIILIFVGILGNRREREWHTKKKADEQRIVTLRTRPEPSKAKPRLKKVEPQKQKSKEVVKRKSVRRLGALAVLGGLKKKGHIKRDVGIGGVNLGSIKTSPGPGLGGGKGGSGGAQASLYAKGLVAAPLGMGGNTKGSGGYKTKGKGGGRDGYGQTTLIGSLKSATIPAEKELIVEGGLDRDSVSKVIERNMGQITFCYEQGLQRDPNLTGRIVTSFIIGTGGRVKASSLKSSTLNSRSIEKCVLLRLRTWQFPIPAGGVEVKVSAYSFLFKRKIVGKRK